MKLATLNHIHDLLIHEVEVTQKAKHIAYVARNDAEDNEAPNVEDLRAVYENARESWRAAADALEDFERQDW